MKATDVLIVGASTREAVRRFCPWFSELVEPRPSRHAGTALVDPTDAT